MVPSSRRPQPRERPRQPQVRAPGLRHAARVRYSRQRQVSVLQAPRLGEHGGRVHQDLRPRRVPEARDPREGRDRRQQVGAVLRAPRPGGHAGRGQQALRVPGLPG